MAKVDLQFERPLLNAAGTLGFVPDRNCPVDIRQLGAFVTNPISLEPRRAAHGTRVLTYPGGFLLHTGFPNPGLRAVTRRYARRWAQMPLPVLVHILARTAAEVHKMVLALESLEGVAGLELGLPPGIDPANALSLGQAAWGERPLVMRLPYENALEIGRALVSNGGGIVSLSPPRGMLLGAGGAQISGRLYGPAVFPLMLPVVQALAEMGLGVIGGGGISTPQDTAAMLAAGAFAIQLDSLLWRGEIPAVS